MDKFVVDGYKDKNKKHNRLTNEQKEMIISLKNKGVSLYKISEQLGINYSTVKAV